MEKFKAPEITCGCGKCESGHNHHNHKHNDSCSHSHCCESHSNEHSENGCCHQDCGKDSCQSNDDDSGDEEHHHTGGILSKVSLGLSAVVILTMVILHLTIEISPIIVGISCGIATILVGYETFLKGIKSLIKLKINETTLMTIAVVAAFCLGEYTEGALVTLLFAFGELMEDIAVSRSRKSIEKLAQIRPDSALLITDNGEVETPAESIPVGSTILIRPYARIPLDGIIIEGSSSIDTSAITGESVPLEGTVNTSLMSGMKNGEGVIKLRTTKTAENSAASRILKMVQDSQKNKGNSEKLITRFARIYTPIVMVIAVLIAVVPILFGGDFNEWIYRSLVCLVASCPCSIVISVPLAYFAGIGGASKKGIMIKGGKYIEALAKADCFVFDKTGTLTSGKMSVNEITKYGSLKEEEILRYCAIAEQYSTHPIAQAIKDRAKAENIDISPADKFREKAGYGVTAVINEKNISVGSINLLSDDEKKKVKSNNSVFLLVNGVLEGGITVGDTIRQETAKVLCELRKAGANSLVMLTGDNKDKAKAVAEKTGITELHSDLLPEEKVSHMEEIKANHKSTVFVGDGINDAPVIALADCGVAMGLGTDAAIEASDAVLSDGTLRQLPAMKKISKRIMNTIKADISFSLIIKALVIILAIMGIAPMWLGVLSDTGMTMICVLYTMRLIR